MSAAVSTNPALIPGIAPTQTPAPAAAPAGARQHREGQSIAGLRSGPAFSEVLQKASAPDALHFSRHALERAQRRGIDLGPSTLSRLGDGVGRAAAKGARDSVVLVDGTAFVVSVPNRTVVTAVGAEHMRDQVFTNIDSAVIA